MGDQIFSLVGAFECPTAETTQNGLLGALLSQLQGSHFD